MDVQGGWKMRVLGGLLGTWLLGGAAWAAGSPVYSLQLASFSSEEEAKKSTEDFRRVLPSARVEYVDGSKMAWKVVAGAFTTRAEAWANKELIPTQPASFIVRLEAPALSASATSGIAELPFDTVGLAEAEKKKEMVTSPDVERTTALPSADLLLKKAEKMSRAELLSVGIYSPKNAAGIPALEEFLARHGDDPEANAARLRLARRLMGRKEYDGAQRLLDEVSQRGTVDEKGRAKLLGAYVQRYSKGNNAGWEAFRALANDGANPATIRREAMRIAAGSAHAAGHLAEALLAFRQLEENAANVEERTDAMLQRAAIMYELAGRAKGSWPEAQEACVAVTKVEGVSRTTAATAELMHLEALFHGGDTRGALAEVDPFIAKYSDIKREATSAKVWRGVLLCKSMRLEEARRSLQAVVDLELLPEDKFGTHEPQAMAAYWLRWIALQRNDSVAASQYASLIQDRFPKSPEALSLAKLTASVEPPVPSDAKIGEEKQ